DPARGDVVGPRVGDARDAAFAQVLEHEPKPDLVVDPHEVGDALVRPAVHLHDGEAGREGPQRVDGPLVLCGNEHDAVDAAVAEDPQTPDLLLEAPVGVGEEQLEARQAELFLDGVDELAAAHPAIELRAITTVAGNGRIDHTTYNGQRGHLDAQDDLARRGRAVQLRPVRPGTRHRGRDLRPRAALAAEHPQVGASPARWPTRSPSWTAGSSWNPATRARCSAIRSTSARGRSCRRCCSPHPTDSGGGDRALELV